MPAVLGEVAHIDARGEINPLAIIGGAMRSPALVYAGLSDELAWTACGAGSPTMQANPPASRHNAATLTPEVECKMTSDAK